MCGIADAVSGLISDVIVDPLSDIVMDVTGQSAVLEQQQANADAQAQAILSASLSAAQAAQAQASAAATSINQQVRQETLADTASAQISTVEQGPTVVQAADTATTQRKRRVARFKVQGGL